MKQAVHRTTLIVLLFPTCFLCTIPDLPCWACRLNCFALATTQSCNLMTSAFAATPTEAGSRHIGRSAGNKQRNAKSVSTLLVQIGKESVCLFVFKIYLRAKQWRNWEKKHTRYENFSEKLFGQILRAKHRSFSRALWKMRNTLRLDEATSLTMVWKRRPMQLQEEKKIKKLHQFWQRRADVRPREAGGSQLPPHGKRVYSQSAAHTFIQEFSGVSGVVARRALQQLLLRWCVGNFLLCGKKQAS